ncbi:GNAT family N-acetyltransferase [Candidatus Pacearchaeota archaeon]|nr:GNAT family N-acetyltransferase [Candidatus Pacearchaeota archaeon]
MTIRLAKKSEVLQIKKFVDSFEEIDTTKETFSLQYYKRIIKKGILLVAEENKKIIGVCFGTYNVKEKWADLLGIAVKNKFRSRGIGRSLVKEFENFVKSKKLKTIDLYDNKNQVGLFKNLGYKKGRVYIAFRKKFH